MKQESSDYMLNIKEGLVIAPNHIKTKILKEISQNNRLVNIRIITLPEFTKNYYGTYKKEALYFLMHKYNLNYVTATTYLNNIFINSQTIKPYFEALKKENLLKQTPYFKENLNNITIIGYENIDPYLLKELQKYNLTVISEKTGNLQNCVHEFASQTEELTFIAQSIIDKIQKQNVDINDIFIAGIKDEYKSELIRIFNLFNIPFNFNTNPSLYSAQTTQTFLKELNKTKKLQSALDILPPSNLKNQIIDLLNDLELPVIDKTSIEIITAKLQKITLKQETVKNAVQIINLDQINSPHHHYFIAGLNQGIIPHIYKDDDIISDQEKASLGILTSLQKNEIAKNHFKHLVKTFPNLTLSYKLKDTFNTYYPSSIIDELNLPVQKDHQQHFTYSHNYNKLKLGILLDNYFNYNEKNDNLKALFTTYPTLNYGSYQNNYKQINKTTLKEYLKNGLTLSYTSLNNYALCPFKFYIKHILKLEPYTETFPILIGNLFHHTLSHMYDKNFDLKSTYYGYLKDKTLTPKETFYLDKLYNILKNDIDIIRWQETHSLYQHHLTEKKVEIDKSSDIKITFTGIIDKLNYYETENQTKAIIIDYKTGQISTDLNNINYGLNMQLPVYVYLTKKALGQNYQVTGFYLQKVLTDQTLDSDDPDQEFKKNLKLNGYTIDQEPLISEIDSTYKNSEIIQSMKQSKTGFYNYTKIISAKNITKLINLTEKNIDNNIKNILNANFQIAPKRISNENISCKYCPFKDICYAEEKDIVDLKETKFKDIIGDDNNA